MKRDKKLPVEKCKIELRCYKELPKLYYIGSTEEWLTNDIIHNDTSLCRGSKHNINEFLIGVIENFKINMKTGIPDLQVPVLDPFLLKKPIRLNKEHHKASVHANFTDIQVEGLSSFIIESLRVDISNLSLQFQLRVPWITARGNYSLDGNIIKIIPLLGNGEFVMEALKLTVGAKASMTTSEDDQLQLSDDFDVEIYFAKVVLHLQNFLRGGRWSGIFSKIINDISKDLVKKFLPCFKEELKKSLMKVINKRLQKLSITSIVPGSNADGYIDQIFFNIQSFVKRKHLEPMVLPDYLSNFTKKMMHVTFNLYEGWISGLSTIHRTDKCKVKVTKQAISVSAHLGLNDLNLRYKGQAKFMSQVQSLICSCNVGKVSFYFKIEQSNRKGAKPELKDFKIIEMSTIWIKLSGLGPMGWLLKWLLAGISEVMKNFIIEKLTFLVKDFMEYQFQNLPFLV